MIARTAETSLDELIKQGIIEMSRGKVISKKDISSNTGGFPVYSSSVMNGGLFGKYGKFMFDEELVTWSVDGGGNFFYRKPHKFSITNVSGYIRVLRKDILSTKYLAYVLIKQHQNLKFDYSSKAHPSVIKDLYKIKLIPLPEQEKIAALFSKLDERIELREKKIASLKEYKKGLQQAVFGTNGERTLRFKDAQGNEYPEWVEHKFGDVSTMFKGKGLSKKDISDSGSSCILYGQLYTTYETIINNPVSNTNAIIEKPVLSQRGYILMPSSGETSEAIAVASVVNFDEPAILGGDLNVIRVDQSIINPIFLSYQIRSSLKQEISQVAQGHTVVHLYNSQLQEVKSLVPCLEEQEKIANLFSKIDNQIELEEQLLQSAKDEKQGLMQRVF